MNKSYVRADKQFLIAAMGFTTTLLTAAILSIVEIRFEIALYSYMFWFIVPVGAGFSGFAAASGYYAGARLFHQRPAGGVLFNMIAASGAAFLLVHYIPYSQLEIEGIRVSELLPFWEYLDMAIRATSYGFVRGKASTGELGEWGYVVALIQLAGFAVGGWLVFLHLQGIPYCEKCSRYLSKTGEQVRFSGDGEAMAEGFKELVRLIAEDSYLEALDYHAEKMGAPKWLSEHHLRSLIVIHRCALCGLNHFRFVMSKKKRDDWSDISETEIPRFTEEQLNTRIPAGAQARE